MFDLLIYQICMFQTMVFAGTWDGRIFDVLFVRGTMNLASYQAHVKNVCIPKLKQENGGSLQGAIFYKSLRVKSPPPPLSRISLCNLHRCSPLKTRGF